MVKQQKRRSGSPEADRRWEVAHTTARVFSVVKRSSNGVDGNVVGREGSFEGGEQGGHGGR